MAAGGNLNSGGGGDGTVRHHIWVHNAYKPAVRWDGTDGINGTDHLCWSNARVTLTKGDFHKVYQSTGVLSFDQTNPMLKVVDDNDLKEDDPNFAERNANTEIYNNIADSISAERSGYTPLNGTNDKNWNGYLHTDFGDVAAAQLIDPNNLDFRPRPSSADFTSGIIDMGLPLPGYNDDAIGTPDIGAYEYDSTKTREYWIPGYQDARKALGPVPMNDSLSALPTTDLMWLPAQHARNTSSLLVNLRRP